MRWPRCSAISRRANSGLKVFDCYRPQQAVAHFVRWARRIGDVKRKSEFYPDIDKRVLFKQGYIAERSGHSRGATVDLTWFGAPTQRARHGLAVRLFQPEIMALGQERERTGAEEPRGAGRGDDARRVSAIRQGMVALYAGARTVSRHLFRFPGALTRRIVAGDGGGAGRHTSMNTFPFSTTVR